MGKNRKDKNPKPTKTIMFRGKRYELTSTKGRSKMAQRSNAERWRMDGWKAHIKRFGSLYYIYAK